MDKSYEAAKSEGSSEEEWLDLSKSDYAKVIFSNLYWRSESGDVGCYFSLTETVKKNPSDYVGIYKVGYDDLSQCLALKKLSDINCEDDSKPIHCGFKSEELPKLHGFYQFLYVTHEKEVCGASMPFEVKLPQKENPLEEVVTERIENDFLIVRYGLEQKNCKLETLLKVYEAENVVLVAKIKELKGEKAALVQKLEEIQSRLDYVTLEYEQLEDNHLVSTNELKMFNEKQAAAVKLLAIAKKHNIQVLTEVRDAFSSLLNFKDNVEDEHGRAEADIKFLSESFQENMEEEAKLIEILDPGSNLLRDNFNQIKQQYSNLSGDCVDTNNIVDQLASEILKLMEDLASKEKIRMIEWDQKNKLLEDNFKNASSKIIQLEEENAMLRYLWNPQEYRNVHNERRLNSRMPVDPTPDEFLIGQLEDAKFMIKALEDSKQLAMKEMHEISEKLKKAEEKLYQYKCVTMDMKVTLEKMKSSNNTCSETSKQSASNEVNEILKKTKEELNQLRCENMALKIFLEEKSNSDQCEANKSHAEEKIQPHMENILMNLLSKLKETDPTADMNNLERKLMDLITSAVQQAEIISKAKQELNQLRCQNMALKVFLEEKPSCSALAEISHETVSEERKSSHKELVDENVKLRNECILKENEIKSLKEKIEIENRTTVEAIMNAEDKTARIVQAAELYKDLYKEKEKLSKQLKKLKLVKSRSKKSSVSSAQDNLKPNCLTLNIEKALTCSETTSNNSDSDTGELVRAQILYPDLKKDENYTLECSLPRRLGNNLLESSLSQPVVIDETPNSDDTSSDVTINNSCGTVTDDHVYEVPPKAEALSMQTVSVEEDSYIPCLICGEKFLITPHSNMPMIDHLEKVHNIDLCPLCGQMFDKSFPSKYLMFHINDHFKSE